MPLDRETVTPSQWSRFFDLIAKCNTVSHACKITKISRATAYYLRNKHEWIDARWKEAELAGTEYLESAGLNRAIRGVKKEKGIYFEGQLIAVEVEHKYSDTIWLAAMAARDPRYKRETPDTKVAAELRIIFDKLQRGLTNDEYSKVLSILASSEEAMIDVTPTHSAHALSTTETTDND